MGWSIFYESYNILLIPEIGMINYNNMYMNMIWYWHDMYTFQHYNILFLYMARRTLCIIYIVSSIQTPDNEKKTNKISVLLRLPTRIGKSVHSRRDKMSTSFFRFVEQWVYTYLRKRYFLYLYCLLNPTSLCAGNCVYLYI